MEVERQRREWGSARQSSAALTKRQLDVLRLLADGLSLKEIAGLLGITKKTAEFHRYQISDRLGLRGTGAIVRYAIQEGLVDLYSPQLGSASASPPGAIPSAPKRQFRIRRPLCAVRREAGRPAVVVIPPDSTLVLEGIQLLSGLTDGIYLGQRVSVFMEDLLERGEILPVQNS